MIRDTVQSQKGSSVGVDSISEALKVFSYCSIYFSD